MHPLLYYFDEYLNKLLITKNSILSKSWIFNYLYYKFLIVSSSSMRAKMTTRPLILWVIPKGWKENQFSLLMTKSLFGQRPHSYFEQHGMSMLSVGKHFMSYSSFGRAILWAFEQADWFREDQTVFGPLSRLLGPWFGAKCLHWVFGRVLGSKIFFA